MRWLVIMIWLGAAGLQGQAAPAASPTPTNIHLPPIRFMTPPGQTSAPAARRGWWREPPVEQTNAFYVTRTIPVHDSQGNRVVLRNFYYATNVTLQRVVTFLRTNPVNLANFEPGKFVCTEFGQALHNAAEAAGLRCGLVLVDFEKGEGHVLNAFDTTDKGVVYVDCTGSITPNAPRAEFDTFGYLQVGKKYGRLPLSQGYADPNHYEHYEKIEQAWIHLANDRVRHDQEWKQLLAQDRALEAEERKVGPPPWSPAIQAMGEALKRRREALDTKYSELRKLQFSVNQRAAQMRGRIFHSNPAPVAKFKTWW